MEKEFDSMTRRLGWRDVQLIKAAVFLITLPIGAYLSQYILPYWWVFIVLGVLASVKPVRTVLGK